MLRLEACTGYSIPDEIEAVMIENLQYTFDNPDHLCLFPMDHDVFPRAAALGLLEYHSMREGLLALTQMITRRNSDWARDKTAGMIDTIDRISDTGLQPWNVELLDRWQRLDNPGAPVSRTVLDSGRFMEAGMIYVQATGNEQALELVGRFAGAGTTSWASRRTTRVGCRCIRISSLKRTSPDPAVSSRESGRGRDSCVSGVASENDAWRASNQ